MTLSLYSTHMGLLRPFQYGSVMALLLTLCTMSCQREPKTLDSQITASQRAAIEQAGFQAQGAYINKSGNIIVEGDIAISPEYLPDVSDKAGDRQRMAGENCVRQYIETGTPLAYYISTEFDETWKEGIRTGVDKWLSTLNNCTFEEVQDPADAAVVFKVDNTLGHNVFGLADFPCFNHGRNIYLNVHEVECYHGSTPLLNCIVNVSTHEFGHTLGFHHSDSFAELLSGTPASDPNSIMLSGEAWPTAPAGLPWFGALSGPDANDYKMAEYVFPRDGAHPEVAQIQLNPEISGFSSVRFKYKQVIALCYRLHYEFKAGESLLQSGDLLSDGNSFAWVSIPGIYPAGAYTLTLCGKNYGQDYNPDCQLASTTTIILPTSTCCPLDH